MFGSMRPSLRGGLLGVVVLLCPTYVRDGGTDADVSISHRPAARGRTGCGGGGGGLGRPDRLHGERAAPRRGCRLGPASGGGPGGPPPRVSPQPPSGGGPPGHA